jgi:uncharacterized membrane protein
MAKSAWAGSFSDSLADVIAWVAIILISIVGLIVYWQIHYLPSKIAEKRQLPQKEAIHAMCMVSRFSGGLFWPIAFVWAHLRPTIVPLSKTSATLFLIPKSMSLLCLSESVDLSCFSNTLHKCS